jgi:dCTP diphosphatase
MGTDRFKRGVAPARPMPTPLEALRADLRRFVEARDWDRFHDAKDLALSLNVEAGELLELFQWREAGKPLSDEERRRVAEETADVLLYALLLADKTGFDLVEAARQKLAANAAKYPVEKARGRADKYDRL